MIEIKFQLLIVIIDYFGLALMLSMCKFYIIKAYNTLGWSEDKLEIETKGWFEKFISIILLSKHW